MRRGYDRMKKAKAKSGCGVAETRVGKNPGFKKKKPAQWVFLVFFGFFGVFWVFLGSFGFFPRREDF